MADFDVQLQCGPCLAAPEVVQRFLDLHSMGAASSRGSTEEKENSDREDEEEEEETADEPWSR
jgi:hypothetical protein